MTRADELERKQERNRREYEARKEDKKAQVKRWYDKNHEYALMRAAAYRQRRRREAKFTKTPPPSTDALEAQLPPALRANIPRLRKEFLKIPILQRPPYDVYLKLKTIEHLENKTDDKRTENQG